MSAESHIHTDDIIVDADVHFTINPTTRMISNQNEDRVNKKLTLLQYDNNSERYSFDIDRYIDKHDLMSCNKVTVHFVNIGSGRSQRNLGSYLVTDVHVHETDPDKITFSWLVSSMATLYSGALHFLVSFECIDGDNILYRWSTTTFNAIQIVAGMKNGDELVKIYSDELLLWQNSMENDVIPNLVDECYIDREFATSGEVRDIFDIYDPVEDELIGTDTIPTDGSNNLITSGGVKYYTDNAIAALEARISALEQS